ncbi:MAG TPA: hypothetical protein VJT73_20930, partial [Polyangiaceae bacterium]|nr:hypothetical protein [Polyangiaceae bacterium]
HAPELAASSAESAAAELIERHRQGIARAAERREIERQLADAEQLCAEQIERQSAAERELDDLVRAAGVGGVADLEVAEARSEEARKLDEELAALDARLFELGGNADTLRAELGGEDLDAVTARLEGADEELDQLRRHGSELDVRIGGAQSGLLDLEHPRAKAAEAAAEAESCLARVRNLAESYIKVKVAGALLSREIERYRKENQGPIVSRASELFHRLTLGSFAALTTTFDEKDQPVLRGVRTDGSEIAIDGMSDGTRDQLFLALRLSTLERYVAAHEPMPLVLDDILVHFDDDRARAALEVLGDLATHTQVLFFTHHTRLVDLATQTLPKGKVFVREIDRPLPSPSASVAANGAQK